MAGFYRIVPHLFPRRLYAKAHEVVCNVLPRADIYVFEENPSIVQKDQHLLSKVHLLLFQTALVALLNGGAAENRVFGARHSLVDRAFPSLRVGTERVGLQSRLPELVRESWTDVPESLWRRFHDASGFVDHRGQAREQMGTALLVAVAFRSVMADAGKASEGGGATSPRLLM